MTILRIPICRAGESSMQIRTCTSLIAAVALAASSALAQNTGATPVKPMAADAHPSFAVATIKPHDPDERDRGIWVQGDHFDFSSASVLKPLLFSYSINPEQVIGGPDWLRDAKYDINGRPDAEGEPNLAEQQEMIQKLLADRFQLKFHGDTRVLPVYAIRVAKVNRSWLRPPIPAGSRSSRATVTVRWKEYTPTPARTSRISSWWNNSGRIAR